MLLVKTALAVATAAALLTCPLSHWLLEEPWPLQCQPEDTVVVITGISSGIGKDVAQRLASLGHLVIGTVRTEADARRVGGLANIVPVLCDITELDGIRRLAFAVAEARGGGKRLLGLVNNAGISMRAHLTDWRSGAAVDAFDRVLAVNVNGLAKVTSALTPALLEDAAAVGGCGSARVVNVGSLAGFAARASDPAYAASKAAVERLTDSLRRLMRPNRVWVAALEPGFIASRMCDAERGGCQQPRRTTTPAVVHALTSARPLPRYAVAGASGLSAPLIVSAFSHLPDALTDALLRVLDAT